MLIVRAELTPGRLTHVRLAGDVIAEVGPALRPRPDEEVLDAGGHAVLPGLHDHHVHLRAAAARRGSLDASTVPDAEAFTTALRQAATGRPPGAWLRVVGYHERLAGPLDRGRLDELAPSDRPVRVQHRTGELWVLNTAGVRAAGLEHTREPGVDADAGHLWRRDDLLRRLSSVDPAALADLGRHAAALGITGFTDATPDSEPTDAHDLADDLRAAGITQRLHLMGPVGAVVPGAVRSSLGPVKVLLDDTTLPPLDELAATVRAAHGDDRPVAIHCVTRVQLVVAVAALEAAGVAPGDRIEHASVVPAELVPTLASLGVTVVTQPHFVAERGDEYRSDVEPDDRPALYRLRSLLDAGVAVAAGTDAPFGTLDPWASMAAAMERRTAAGHPMAPEERIDLAAALALYTGDAMAPGRPRAVQVGSPADLCLLGVPWRGLETSLRDRPVAGTIIAGEPAAPTARC